MNKIKKGIIYLFTYAILATSLLFGAEENLNKFSIIRDEVTKHTPIYTHQYGQNIKGVNYGVEVQGGHVQEGGLGSTSRTNFNGNSLLGYKNSKTVLALTVNDVSRDEWKFPLKEQGEEVVNLGTANAVLKFETRELPILPRLGMDTDKPELYQLAKVIHVTLNVEPIAGQEDKGKEEGGWFDPGLRYNYENEVRALKNKYLAGKNLEDMSDKDLEAIARQMHAERRELGIKFKNATPELLRKGIYDRNWKKYGDKLGPTIAYFRNVQGKSWKEIIDSSSRPGGGDLWYLTIPSYKWGQLKNWVSGFLPTGEKTTEKSNL